MVWQEKGFQNVGSLKAGKRYFMTGFANAVNASFSFIHFILTYLSTVTPSIEKTAFQGAVLL